jgi:hypothetical protein
MKQNIALKNKTKKKERKKERLEKINGKFNNIGKADEVSIQSKTFCPLVCCLKT